MKKLLQNPIAIILSVLASAYFLFLFLSWTSESVSLSNSYNSSVIDNPVNDTSYGGLFYKPTINDSLPHFQYKQIEDSLIQKNELRLGNNEIGGNSFSNGLIGFTESAENDQTALNSKKSKQYFLSLGGFELEEDVKFYIERNSYNLVYVQWDTVQRTGDNIERIGTYKSVVIPVQYSKREKKILIPISAKQYKIGYILLIVLSILMGAMALYVIFGYPIQFLVRISKGQAFTEVNVAGLRMTTLLLFLFFIGSVVFPFILRVIFSSYIHPLFKPLKFWSQLYDCLPSFFLAVLVFAIYIAFKKGYKLQKEQELTV
ncbi:DUF2975 domain-containing protein [Lacibacter luteus]|uniref:DUF2975 domain-containing protein n=1 Tax=Lacibacter luteus TaxID=2508719 RepID=A0A4Q1CHH9_9BACT|nr:DUF2975 domain-containing protein [Lacibacter luteus]RXK59778.1 DUF2975 domain-containing protein [Lacibacter luteus]